MPCNNVAALRMLRIGTGLREKRKNAASEQFCSGKETFLFFFVARGFSAFEQFKAFCPLRSFTEVLLS